MGEVEEYCDEPDDVDDQYPDVAECGSEELVRIFSMVSHEFLELHVSPEMREVEEENAENHDAEHEHVLG